MPADKIRLYAVDVSSYVFRAFHAIPPLSNKDGLPTNAVLGVANMLFKLLSDERPDRLAIVFDSPGPTFRHDLFPEYKANRSETPDDLKVQMPYVRRLIEALRLPCIEVPGVEADDVIATLVERFSADVDRIVIVSGDKDLMQLVGPRVSLFDTMRNRRFGVDEVRARFGVAPERFADVLGLMGDAVDNVPGVKGIGEKTARALVRRFGGIEELLGRLDEVEASGLRGARGIRQKLENGIEQARLSRSLVVLQRDVPLDVSLDGLGFGRPDLAAARPLFLELGLKRFLDEAAPEEASKSGTTGWIESRAEFEAQLPTLLEREIMTLEMISGEDGDLAGLAIGLNAREACVLWFRGGELGVRDVARLLEPEKPRKCADDLKALSLRLARQGVTLAGPGFDTAVASYVTNPSRPGHGLAELSVELLGRRLPDGEGGDDKRAEAAAERARTLFRIRESLSSSLNEQQGLRLFEEVEMPLLEVLARMEARGIRVDVECLGALSAELESRMSRLLAEVYEIAGTEFNVGSTPQLREILFERLAIPTRGVRRGKTGLSTDVDVLTRLAREHPLPAKVLDYRRLAKLKSTYLDALPALVDPATGRIHTSFNQTVAATGRLSSSNPNLQNIPIRTDEGRRIRAAFVPEPGWKLISADYSQIELRVLAHVSGDETLIGAFRSGEDIHVRTASEVFHVEPASVTPDQRRAAKVINFGILYGMGPGRLSKALEIPTDEAKRYIESYFARYPGVARYVERTLEGARAEGWVSTLLGRRRYIPDLASREAGARQFAERAAVNTPIQGTAADLIKVAMVQIERRLEGEKFAARMLLQVHDELVLEAPVGEASAAAERVAEEMRGAASLDVPLEVSIGIGDNWSEVH